MKPANLFFWTFFIKPNNIIFNTTKNILVKNYYVPEKRKQIILGNKINKIIKRFLF